MADGSFEQIEAQDGTITYQSQTKNGALTITTTYDADFNVTGTSIERAYSNIRSLDEMSEEFQRAWAAVSDKLPASLTAPEQVVQFADDRNNLVVIATKDVGDVLNGDVLGRVNKWSNEGNEGTWQRWVNDEVIDVQNQEWSYNFHDTDWNRVAEYGERELFLVLDDGLVLDETGSRSASFVRKADTDQATWTKITETVSAEQLTAIGANVSWADVDYVELQTNSWAAKENLYRTADQLWSDSEDQILVHGKIGNDDNTVFIGSIAKRDGFIVIRDSNWDEVARLTDPASAMKYADVKALYGDAFDTAWEKIGASLPDTFKSAGQTKETSLLYNVDKWGNILVFDEAGVMIGEIGAWSHADTWDRPWDDEYPTETYENINFHFRAIEKTESGDKWTDIGRYGEGKNTYHSADGETDLLDRSWNDVSSTIYERELSDSDWASLEATYLSDLVAQKLNITWADVGQLEVSENTHTHYPNEWRDTTDVDTSQSVRFYAEIPMNGGDWYVNKFLGGANKQGGFIEIYGSDWNTIARVADPDKLMSWDEVKAEAPGLEQAWDDVDAFLPSEIDDPAVLKYSIDDNNIYAFTAAGVMAAQISYWNNDDQWDGWFDGQVLPVKNVHYDYNFNDAEWNNIANAGGFDRYIIEKDGNLVHDETGTNIGVKIYKDAVDPSIWADYDPEDATGTIVWDDVTEVRVQTDTWKSISNEYRRDDWGGISSNTRIEFFDEVEGHGWGQFVGAVEERDGYIEIRDKHWNVIAQRIDPNASPSETSYQAMVLKYGSGFKDAWVELADMLPSVFKDENGATIQESLKYTSDKWGNILVFEASGAMIGEIGYWSNEDTWDRSWDKEYTSETHENVNFNFRILDTSNGNMNTIDIARYEVGSNTLIKGDGSKDVDRVWEQVSSTLFERYMTPDEWAKIGEEYFNEKLTELLGFTWEDVDKIETGTRERTEYAVRWRTKDETSTERQIEFIREIEMNDGDWYAHDFLGSMQYRDGFIEILDADWNTVARIVDSSNAKTFAEVLVDNPQLDWAWDQVKYNLPDAAQDRDALSFTTGGEYDPIAAFDSTGTMVLQIGRWSWQESWTFGGVKEDEAGYGYNFQDENWNRYAQADINERYVSDANHEPALDNRWQSVSSNIKKADLSTEAWEKFNPNDTTGTIVWEDIVELSVGVNEWQSFENFNRDKDHVYSGDQERIEYFIEVGDAWSTWTERVASTERSGNLLTIYDNDWNRVDQIVFGDVEGIPLKAALDAADKEIITQYGDIIAEYLDINSVEIIDSSSGPMILVQDGSIIATVERYENFENGGTELYYGYDIRDTQGNNILRLGGWNALDGDGNVLEKPNGVQIGEYYYKEQLDPDDWAALKVAYGITWDGFDWETVGAIEKRIWRNDGDSDGTYDERNEVRFIQVDDQTGRQNWDYFNALYDGPIITVKDGDWNTLGSYVREGAGLTKITDLNDFSTGFLDLVNDTGILDGRFNSGALSYFKEDETGKLLVAAPDGSVRVVVTEVTDAWNASFGDTQLGYELRRPDDSYIGWLWKSTQSTAEDPFEDADGNTFVGATKIASNMYFRPGTEQLSSEAWAFLNTVFKPNVDVDHEFYDLSQATMRLEEWVDGSGNTVGKNVLIQHNLPGVNGWTIRTGFDLINGKAISISGGDAYADPVITDTYLDMSKVEAGIDAFIQHAFHDKDFPSDLGILDYYVVDNPVLDIVVDASSYFDGEDALTAAYASGSETENTSYSQDKSTFTFTVDDGVTSHEGTITSTFTDFGLILDTYVDANGITLGEILYDLEGFVADAVGEANLDNLVYTAEYVFDDDATDGVAETQAALSYGVSDAGLIWNYEPLSMQEGDFPILLVPSQSVSMVNFYTPDDAISIEVFGLESTAFELVQNNQAADFEIAMEMAIEDFTMDFFDFLDTDPMNGA